MVRNPGSISDGVAIMYIALLTGIYYLLSKKIALEIETRPLNIMLMLAGIITFTFFYFKF